MLDIGTVVNQGLLSVDLKGKAGHTLLGGDLFQTSRGAC
jgi:hypothetical protein